MRSTRGPLRLRVMVAPAASATIAVFTDFDRGCAFGLDGVFAVVAGAARDRNRIPFGQTAKPACAVQDVIGAAKLIVVAV